MLPIGFSTGALFRGALPEGVAAVRHLGLDVIELSALRKRELHGLVDFVASNDLSGFRYLSLHAPTDYAQDEEAEVARVLLSLSKPRGWPVIVHPDCLANYDLWNPFEELLCIENMDKRKSRGRTVEELRPLFERYRQARLCFDIGHAYQVDTSMTEAYRILREFHGRICQFHVSEVTSSGKHDRISESALSAFRDVAELFPRNVPVILETPVDVNDAKRELRMAERLFEAAAVAARP